MFRLFLIVLLCFVSVFCQAGNDGLQVEIDRMPSSVEKSIALRQLAMDWLEVNADSALFYAQSGYKLAVQLKSDSAIFANLYAVGVAFDYKNELDSALHYYNTAIARAQQKGDRAREADFIFSKGAANYYQNNFAEAIKYYDQALSFWEETGNLEKQSRGLNNMAIVYRVRNQYDKAIITYRRSIDIKEQLGDTLGLAHSYNNMGRAFYYNDKVEESLKNYKIALGLFAQLGREYDMAMAQANIGLALLDKSHFEEARQYLLEAQSVLGEKLSMELLSTELALATIERHQGETSSAIVRLLKYYDAVTEWNRLDSRMTFEEQLSLCYADAGDYQKAYDHLSEYQKLFAESASESRERLAKEMETRFETREKENTIRLQELDLKNTEREKQNLFISVAFIFVLLTGAVGFSVSKTRHNRRLTTEKTKTEAALKDRETLLREIHHRVKNNLQVVSSLLSIQGREITDDRALQAVNESRNRVHSMALIHQFLYGEEHLSSINMQEYVQQLVKSLFSTYSVNHDKVELHVEVDPILLDVDTAIPVGLILNELITNSLKYAFPDGRAGNLFISLKEKNAQLEVLVKDDGVGVSGEIKSSSFGMKLLNAFKNKLDADYEIKNLEGLAVHYHIRKYKTA